MHFDYNLSQNVFPKYKFFVEYLYCNNALASSNPSIEVLGHNFALIKFSNIAIF